MKIKPLIALCATALLLTGCVHRYKDAALQQHLAGSWTTKDVQLPSALLTDIKLKLGPDGSYFAQYMVNRPNGSEQAETLSGTWHIEHGMFLESLTNSAGQPAQPNGGSKILKVKENSFVISNWNNPHRVFTRTQ